MLRASLCPRERTENVFPDNSSLRKISGHPHVRTGHAKSSDGDLVKSTVTDKYVQMVKDTKFRAEVAEQIGLGFDLPKVEPVEVVPSVPNSQKTEVAVSI